MPKEVSLDYEPGVLRVLQTKSETKAFYDKIAKVYDLLAEHSERPMREAGLRLLAAGPGEHMLEIGFGTGHILAELAEAVGPTGKVFGIDLSENMLAHARDLLSSKGLLDRVSLDCGDAESLPYGDDSMDGIFMCFTLELFDTPDIPKVLVRVQARLAAGRAHRGCGRVQGRQGRVRHPRLRVDASPLSQSDGLPADLRPPGIRGQRLRHRRFADRLHVGSRRDCEGQKAKLKQSGRMPVLSIHGTRACGLQGHPPNADRPL